MMISNTNIPKAKIFHGTTSSNQKPSGKPYTFTMIISADLISAVTLVEHGFISPTILASFLILGTRLSDSPGHEVQYMHSMA